MLFPKTTKKVENISKDIHKKFEKLHPNSNIKKNRAKVNSSEKILTKKDNCTK